MMRKGVLVFVTLASCGVRRTNYEDTEYFPDFRPAPLDACIFIAPCFSESQQAIDPGRVEVFALDLLDRDYFGVLEVTTKVEDVVSPQGEPPVSAGGENLPGPNYVTRPGNRSGDYVLGVWAWPPPSPIEGEPTRCLRSTTFVEDFTRPDTSCDPAPPSIAGFDSNIMAYYRIIDDPSIWDPGDPIDTGPLDTD